MRKVQAAARSSATPSPAPGAESSTPMTQISSAQGHTRAPSALSMRKDSAMNRNDGSTPGTPRLATASLQSASRAQISRDGPSSTAVPGSTAGSLRLKTATKPPSPKQPGRHRLASIPITSPSTPLAETTPIAAATEATSPSPEDSSSERESDESSSPAQSRIIRRPPRFQQQQHHQDGLRSSFLDEDEDEAEPAFLPFRGKRSTDVGQGSHGGSAQYSDPSATLRGDPRDFAANAERRLQNTTGTTDSTSGKGKGKGKEKERVLQQSQTSDSSTSSAALPSNRAGNRRQPSTQLSPRRTAELKGKGYSREGSDGAPSMGSSFSDLDGKDAFLRNLYFVQVLYLLTESSLLLQTPPSRSQPSKKRWLARCRPEGAVLLEAPLPMCSGVDTCLSEHAVWMLDKNSVHLNRIFFYNFQFNFSGVQPETRAQG